MNFVTMVKTWDTDRENEKLEGITISWSKKKLWCEWNTMLSKIKYIKVTTYNLKP